MQLQTDILGISPEATEGDEIATRAFKPPAAKVSGAIEALHHALAQRGTDSLVLLGKKFHIMDNDGNKGVCYEEVCVQLIMCFWCWYIAPAFSIQSTYSLFCRLLECLRGA